MTRAEYGERVIRHIFGALRDASGSIPHATPEFLAQYRRVLEMSEPTLIWAHRYNEGRAERSEALLTSLDEAKVDEVPTKSEPA